MKGKNPKCLLMSLTSAWPTAPRPLARSSVRSAWSCLPGGSQRCLTCVSQARPRALACFHSYSAILLCRAPSNLSCGHCHPLMFTPGPHPPPVPAGPKGPWQVVLSQKSCWCLCCPGGWHLDWHLRSVVPKPLKGISTVVTKFICEEKPQKEKGKKKITHTKKTPRNKKGSMIY